MKKHRRFWWATLTVAALFSVVVLQASGGNQQTRASSTLSIGLSQLPNIVDPMLANPITKIDLAPMYDYIVGVNATQTALSKKTGLALNWTEVNNTNWTFKLRNNVKFSDGTTVTAQDAVYSLNRILSKSARSSYASYFQGIVKTMHAPNPTTLVIGLKHPDFEFPYFLSSMQGTEGIVLPEAYLKQVGDVGFSAHPIGSGPYVLSSFVAGQSMTYTARPGVDPIWGTPKYQKVTFTLSAAQASRVAALQSGQFNLVDFDPTVQDPSTLTNSGFQVFEKPAALTISLSFLRQYDKNSLMSNVKFREALSLAINYSQIQKVVYKGLGTPTGAYAGTWAVGYTKLAPYSYNPTLAKTLLKQSGYNGQAITVYDFNIAGQPGLSLLAEALPGYWNAIGVKTNVQPIDYNSFRSLLLAKKTDVNGVAASGGTNQRFPSTSYTTYFTCAGQLTYVCDPVIDRLVTTLNNSVATAKEYATALPIVDKNLKADYRTSPMLQIGSYYAASSSIDKTWKLGTGVYDFNLPYLLSGK